MVTDHWAIRPERPRILPESARTALENGQPSAGPVPLRRSNLEIFVKLVCLDLEGVLIPEIWINVAERTGIEALRRTTREEPDYDVLMRFRLELLAQHGLSIGDIQDVIAGLALGWRHGWIAEVPAFDEIRHVVLYDFAIHWFDIVNCFLPDKETRRIYASYTRSSTQSAKHPMLAQALIEFDVRGFEPSYGLTGGEDSELFGCMLQSGARFLWCDEARVVEFVEIQVNCKAQAFRLGDHIDEVSLGLIGNV